MYKLKLKDQIYTSHGIRDISEIRKCTHLCSIYQIRHPNFDKDKYI